MRYRSIAAAGFAVLATLTSLTVPSPASAQTPGLVAAYAFNEGSGTTVADISGNDNNGTISAATWTTAGRFGNALVFNGTSARVTVPDAASLQLTTGMTLEAWVFPTARSEEHTSELQSQSNLVCRLLLEKKKKTQKHSN